MEIKQWEFEWHYYYYFIGKLEASQSEDDVKISEITDTTEYRPTGAKMLGIIRDESKDEFIFDFEYIVRESLDVTKHNVLKVIASLYHPVCLIQPILVNMKLFLQTLLKLNLEWDEELAPDLTLSGWGRGDSEVRITKLTTANQKPLTIWCKTCKIDKSRGLLLLFSLETSQKFWKWKIFFCLTIAEIDMGVKFESRRTIMDIETHYFYS